jgi:hypothetical protein
MAKSEKRNINPTAEAVLAMNMWGADYAAQRGGCMDFWDQLAEGEKKRCLEIIDRIREADKAYGVHQ